MTKKKTKKESWPVVTNIIHYYILQYNMKYYSEAYNYRR